MIKATLGTIAGLAIGFAAATPAMAQLNAADSIGFSSEILANKDDNRRIDQNTRDRHYETTRDQNKRR